MNNYQEPVFFITSNVTGFRRIGNFKVRNLIEGVVYAGFTYFLISLIPFVLKVKIIVSLCLCSAIFFLSVVGYKNQSPSELIINLIREKMYMHDYHMRSINDDEGKEIIFTYAGDGESIADKIYKKIQEYREREKTD